MASMPRLISPPIRSECATVPRGLLFCFFRFELSLCLEIGFPDFHCFVCNELQGSLLINRRLALPFGGRGGKSSALGNAGEAQIIAVDKCDLDRIQSSDVGGCVHGGVSKTSGA